ncbi:MAG: RrF2 family transcriptional regulator [Sagittula sp.]|uniref:RrF2 family transcriptional regulator n=1 Tax=Sagittula sp. TaxID=2038081 RepID=UPI00405819A6
MHFSKFTDYALRVCLYLGVHDGRVVPISEIARAHNLSQNNLMKVVNMLVEGSYLKSTRGRSGGVQLARPADEIRVGDVARYMEGDANMVDCSTCILLGSCGLVGALAEAKILFYQTLNRNSIADAIAGHPRTRAILMEADNLPDPISRAS